MKFKLRMNVLFGLSLLLLLLVAACGDTNDTNSNGVNGTEANSNGTNNEENNTDNGAEDDGGDVAGSDDPEALTIASPSEGSPGNIQMIGLGDMIVSHLGMNNNIEPLGGGDAAMFQMQQGAVHFAMVNSLVANDAYEGNDPYEESVNVNLFTNGDTTWRYLVVRKGSGIESLEDLEGSTFMGERPGLPEIRLMADAIVEYAGLEDVNIVSNSTSGETADQLRTGAIDAAIYPGGRNTPALGELFRDEVVEFLYLDDEEINALLDILPPAYVTDSIPAGHYENQEAEYTSLGLLQTINVNSDLSEELVYNIAKMVWENFDEFSAIHDDSSNYSIEANTENNPAIPYHPGVQRYFEEIGEWEDHMNIE